MFLVNYIMMSAPDKECSMNWGPSSKVVCEEKRVKRLEECSISTRISLTLIKDSNDDAPRCAYEDEEIQQTSLL